MLNCQSRINIFPAYYLSSLRKITEYAPIIYNVYVPEEIDCVRFAF